MTRRVRVGRDRSEALPMVKVTIPSRSTRFAASHLVAILVVASVSMIPSDLTAQIIDGTLLERGTDRPIELGLVTLFTADGDSLDSALTDRAGRFSVASATGGEFLLAAIALGYQPTVASSLFTIGDGATMFIQFRIRPLGVEIEGLTVEAQQSLISQPQLVRNGFVERAQRGFGRFITPGEIERARATSTADLLSRTGRVTARYALGGDEVVMLGPRGYCTPIVYLDGIRISMAGISLEAIAPVSVLEAAEVYRSASEAPVIYGGGMSGCGVIVLWTRAR